MLLIGPLGTNFSEILIQIYTFSFKKIHLKRLSAKCQPFCLALNVLKLAADTSENCFTNVSRALQKNISKFVYCTNSTCDENFKLKLCTCAQSLALGTRTNFQIEILTLNLISGVVYFHENILGSSRNVSETAPWTSLGISGTFSVYPSPGHGISWEYQFKTVADDALAPWIGSALVQIMACLVFHAKPLSKPMMEYYHWYPEEQTSVKF